jgi:pentatricopeptide repeat domain-containing protein 1
VQETFGKRHLKRGIDMMNNSQYNGEEYYQGSGGGEYNLHGLFHGLNLGGQQEMSGHGGLPNHGVYASQPSFPVDSFGGGVDHHQKRAVGGGHQAHAQPILDLADGGVLTRNMPTAGGMNAMYQAASFPHHQMNFVQHPIHPNMDVFHGQEHIPIAGHGGFVDVNGVPPAGRSMGWGGQTIEDSQNGYKAMWFGKGQMQGRGPPSHANGNGNRRGRYRGKPNGQGRHPGARNFSRYRSGNLDGSSDAGSDASIDTAIRMISETPQANRIGNDVYDIIKSTDSRAVASLLKELSRMGLTSRAEEVFDTLRSMDPIESANIGLLDVFTYTAAISLCISSHNVDRALHLAAEMQKKKIHCNVHTYTALMNVCIKCSRYGTAMETYEAMRADGCTPNVVTFNTLIDVYGKTGAWEQAIRVLDIMRAEGVDPVLRTYNTLLIACNMCNQPREAIAAYKRMLDEGFTPNSTTYNALISAYGKSGQLEKVMEVFHEMTSRGCERNVITYSSLISACEKAGQWELALELFQEMGRERCNPNTVTFNSLITALGQGGQWEKAKQIFDQMKGRNCTPDVVTYTALISAMEKGGQWRFALRSFEEMRKQGCKADAIVYNAVVNALWETGIIWAQRSALRLFKTALSEGHFPQQSLIPGLVRAEVNLHATTSGVAMLSLYVWLLKLKKFVKENGADAVPAKVTIVTDRGRGAREQGNLIVKEAVTAMMTKWKSPFSLSGQRNYAGNPSLEASGTELAAWMMSSTFDESVFSFFPCSDILPGQERELDDEEVQAIASAQLDDLDHSKEISVEERCSAAFAAVKHFEKTHCLVVQNMGFPYLQQRASLIQNCIAVNNKLDGPEECAHDAVLLMDRVMSTSLNFAPEVFELLSVSCVSIAYDQIENSSAPKDLDSETLEKAAGLPHWAIKQMEWSIRQVLSQDTASISTIRCVKLLLERLGSQQISQPASDAMFGDSLGLCLDCVADTAFLNCRPSITAAAVIYADRRERGIIPFWPSALAKLTGYNDVSALELSVAIKSAQRICGKRSQEGCINLGGIDLETNDNTRNINSLLPGERSTEETPSLFSQLPFHKAAMDDFLPVADISADTHAILQSIQELVSGNGPITPDETEASAQDDSGDQSASLTCSSNKNSSSGHSSEDGKQKV